MTANLDNMPAVALDYLARGHRVAMATVLQTWGSAPRPVGAQLAICDDGRFQGSVSGGCVEGAVVAGGGADGGGGGGDSQWSPGG